LEKDRCLRYQGAAEMRADLQRLKRDTDSGRTDASVNERQSGAETLTRSSRRDQKAALGSQQSIQQGRKLSWKILVFGAALLVALVAGGL